MLFDGIEILEGSEVVNFTLPKGTTFPSSPDQGELFYKTDVKKPYIYPICEAKTPAFMPGMKRA